MKLIAIVFAAVMFKIAFAADTAICEGVGFTHVLATENGREPLRAIRLNYDGSTVSKKSLRDVARFLTHLPQAQLVIVANAATVSDLRAYISELERDLSVTLLPRLRIFENAGDPRIWAQDASKPLVGIDGGGLFSTLTTYPGFGMTLMNVRNTRLLGGNATTRPFAQVLESPIRFEGGNVVVGDRHVLIGPDVIYESRYSFPSLSDDDIIAKISAEFGKPVLVIGIRATDQPGQLLTQLDFHIDITLALAIDQRTGIEVALLNSPEVLIKSIFKINDVSELRDVIGGPESNPSRVFAFIDQKISAGLRGPLSVAERDLINTSARWGYQRLANYIEYHEQVAQTLLANGYQVRRIPGYNYRFPGSMHTVTGITYTNAIFSNGFVLTGLFGIEADQLAYSIYRSLGYTVVPAESTVESFCMSGGIRCLSEAYR